MSARRIGYGRVSTRDQNPDSQRDALVAAGCDPIYVDKASGKLAKRPELDAALAYAREGDVLVITRLSRAARSLRHMLDLADLLNKRGIDLVVLKQGIDTTTPTGRFAFHIIASMDELLRELIVEGTHEGLAAARARGRTGGRRSKLTARQVEQARLMYNATGPDGKRLHTVAAIAEVLGGVSRQTIYRALADDTEASGPPTSSAANGDLDQADVADDGQVDADELFDAIEDTLAEVESAGRLPAEVTTALDGLATALETASGAGPLDALASAATAACRAPRQGLPPALAAALDRLQNATTTPAAG